MRRPLALAAAISLFGSAPLAYYRVINTPSPPRQTPSCFNNVLHTFLRKISRALRTHFTHAAAERYADALPLASPRLSYTRDPRRVPKAPLLRPPAGLSSSPSALPCRLIPFYRVPVSSPPSESREFGRHTSFASSPESAPDNFYFRLLPPLPLPPGSTYAHRCPLIVKLNAA